MNKAVVALAVATALTGFNVSAGTVYKNENGDFLKVYGGAEVGGAIVADKDKGAFKSNQTYVDDSFATIGLKGQTGNMYAKFELDAERTNWTKENNFQLVMDKVYVGYNLAPKHSIEFGRTDTAYDHYDAFGDFSNELAAEISEAGDQDNTLKYRGQYESFKFGISYSTEGWDGETDADGKPVSYTYITDSRFGAVTNGYLGYFGESITVIGAAETVEDRGDIYSIHARAKFGKISLGGFASSSDREKENSDSMTYVLSGKYAFTDKLNGYLVGSMVDHDVEDNDEKWAVFGGEYRYAKNVKLIAEASVGRDIGTIGYLKAYYWF